MRLFMLILSFIIASPALAETLASKIIVFKNERRMELLDSESKVLKTYKIALGAEPAGHKTTEGDERTPEGNYTIISRMEKSRFHRSL